MPRVGLVLAWEAAMPYLIDKTLEAEVPSLPLSSIPPAASKASEQSPCSDSLTLF